MNGKLNLKLLANLIFIIFYCSMYAQLRLDVTGDAKINGNLNLDAGNENVFVGKTNFQN